METRNVLYSDSTVVFFHTRILTLLLGSSASALSTQYVGNVVLKGLVEHSFRGSMNIAECGVSRHGLEKEAPLVPGVTVYPFLPVEQVNPLKYSVEEEHVVSDNHALWRLRLELRARGHVCSRHLHGKFAQLGILNQHFHRVSIIVQRSLVGCLSRGIVLAAEREDEDYKRKSENDRLSNSAPEYWVGYVNQRKATLLRGPWNLTLPFTKDSSSRISLRL